MRWRELENEGAILVVAPEDPYYILWATKKWTQVSRDAFSSYYILITSQCFYHSIVICYIIT